VVIVAVAYQIESASSSDSDCIKRCYELGSLYNHVVKLIVGTVSVSSSSSDQISRMLCMLVS
jgi:hypothetical protein